MLPLSSRALQGGKAESLQVRSLVVGMVIALASAGLGYTARGDGAAIPGVVVSTGTPGAAGTGTSGAGGATALTGTATGALGGVAGPVPAGGGVGSGSAATGAAGGSDSAVGGSFEAGAPAAGSTSGQLSSGPLTKSDQGVTASTIKLGILDADLGGLAAAGFPVGFVGDQKNSLAAWLAEFSRTGGVNGRTVTTFFQKFDPLKESDMQAACKTMTQDQKVFSVITTGGYDSTAQLCIAKENKTPLIASDPEPEQWYQDAAPNLWATFMTKDRIFRNKAKWLKVGGYLRPTDKMGVIYHGIPNVAPSVEDTLLPSLAKNGIKPVAVVKLSSDNNLALGQINNAVLDMRRKGVTFVSFAMNLIFKSQFMQAAEKQNYYPRYDDSDVYFGCYAFTTAAYPDASYDKTQCLTSTNNGSKLGYAPNDFTAYADAVYKRAYPQGYATAGSSQSAQDSEKASNYVLGSELLLWRQAAIKAGTQLTRPLWGKAMQMTGKWTQQVTNCDQSYGPGKFDGSDRLALVQFHVEATDGYAPRTFHTTKPCFKNYA